MVVVEETAYVPFGGGITTALHVVHLKLSIRFRQIANMDVCMLKLLEMMRWGWVPRLKIYCTFACYSSS